MNEWRIGPRPRPQPWFLLRSEPTERIGEQLGQAAGSLIDELATNLHKGAISRAPRDESFDMMLSLHREATRYE